MRLTVQLKQIQHLTGKKIEDLCYFTIAADTLQSRIRTLLHA